MRTVRHCLAVVAFLAAACCLIPSARSQNFFGTPSYNQDVQDAVSAVSLDSLQKFDNELSGGLRVNINGSMILIPHRYAGNGSQQFRNASQHIFNTFSRCGLNPIQENNASPWTKINVVGTLQGRRNAYVVVCGHHDAANTSCPGADDNGSGTAAVMELARVLSHYTFDYTIKFIAFGGEEQGLKGSAQYVQQHASDSIRAVLNMDMIMWDGDSDCIVQLHARANNGQHYSNDLADYVAALTTMYPTGVAPSIVLPGLTGSDHSSFWNANRSAICIIEEYGQDFNPYYHTANDVFGMLNAPKHQLFFHGAAGMTAAAAAHLAGVIGPLPVELASFTASVDGPEVTLDWITASETGNVGFTVQRRMLEQPDFADIGFVPGAGTTTLAQTYRYVDAPAHAGVVQYRLRQTDSDGRAAVSQVLTVDLQGARQFALAQNFPNPASASTRLAWTLPAESPVRLVVSDLLGRERAVPADGLYPAGVHSVTLDVSSLPPGLYLCRLEAGPRAATVRMIVRR
jgi:hypothetical protein